MLLDAFCHQEIVLLSWPIYAGRSQDDIRELDAEAIQIFLCFPFALAVSRVRVGRNHDGNGPGIYTPYKIITNMCGDDVLYASGNYGDHEFSGMLNEFRYDAEAEVP